VISRVGLIALGGFCLIAALMFQNCGKVKFAANNNDAALVAIEDGAMRDENPLEDLTLTPPANGGDAPPNSEPHSPPQPPPPQQNQPPRDEVTERPKHKDGKDHHDLVECMVGKLKVAFADLLEAQHSNASLTRACMSRHACLNLVNSFAAERGCTLTPGIATSELEGAPTITCTSVFPGSRGTCKRAKHLSDEEVSNLLRSMAEKI
jgi:hypothetical protein